MRSRNVCGVILIGCAVVMTLLGGVRSPAVHSQAPATPTLAGPSAQDYLERGLYFHAVAYDTPAALADYTQAITLDPTLTAAYIARGKLYTDLTMFRESLADFDAALEIEPFSAEALVGRAFALLSPNNHIYGDESAGLVDLNRAMTMYPDFAEGHMLMGMRHLWAENYEEAVAEFTEVLEADPTNAEAYLQRWFAYQRQGFFPAEAKADLEQFLALTATPIALVQIEMELFGSQPGPSLGLKTFMIALWGGGRIMHRPFLVLVSCSGHWVISKLLTRSMLAPSKSFRIIQNICIGGVMTITNTALTNKPPLI